MSLAAAGCASRAVVTMIEGNKDEAAKCVALAKKAMLNGDFAKVQFSGVLFCLDLFSLQLLPLRSAR